MHIDTRQRGVVMVITVILLVFLSLIGVALLHASVLEQRMATNTQQSHRVFHAAEAGLEQAFGFARDHRSMLLNGTNLVRQSNFGTVRVDTTTRKLATTNSPPSGFSLGGSFRSHHYAITTHASMNAGAQSTHVGGFVVVGPGTR